jgi:hypothetical protein
MIPPSRPRVFVSSVVEGFAVYREAARKAIEQIGGEAVLVNEDSGAQRVSSRNACLDAVDSADIFLLVIATRGGWRTPSGRLVVEEELEQARRRSLPILVLIEDGDQDADAKRLSKAVSDYVDGYFRAHFEGPGGLGRELARALQPVIEMYQKSAMSPDAVLDYFKRTYKIGEETTLRFVLVPERQEEVIDPVRLASAAFAERLLELGHAKSIAMFSYFRAKEFPAILQDALILEQPASSDRRHGLQAVRVEVHESGAIVIDANVTGQRESANSSDMMSSFRIASEDLDLALAIDFRFANGVFEELDPYKRHQRFYWNAALRSLGYRSFARNPQPSQSYSMDTSQRKEPFMAFPDGRLIDRLILAQPVREIERAVHAWTRKQGRET